MEVTQNLPLHEIPPLSPAVRARRVLEIALPILAGLTAAALIVSTLCFAWPVTIGFAGALALILVTYAAIPFPPQEPLSIVIEALEGGLPIDKGILPEAFTSNLATLIADLQRTLQFVTEEGQDLSKGSSPHEAAAILLRHLRTLGCQDTFIVQLIASGNLNQGLLATVAGHPEAQGRYITPGFRYRLAYDKARRLLTIRTTCTINQVLLFCPIRREQVVVDTRAIPDGLIEPTTFKPLYQCELTLSVDASSNQETVSMAFTESST